MFLLGFFVLSVTQLDIDGKRLMQSFDRASYILADMFPPVFNEPKSLLEAALESVQIAILGTVFGVILSIVLCMFAARNVSPHPSIVYAVKGFAGFVRAVPALIWALLFIIAVGLGPTAGMLAIAVNSIGMLVKVYAESIEEVDQGMIEALKATGATRFQIVTQGILPAVANMFISWSLFRFDINIRYASILGVVGAGGIGWELVRASRLLNYDEALGVMLVIFLIIILSEACTRYLKRKMNASTGPGDRGKTMPLPRQ